MINPGGSGTVPAGLPQGETEQVSIRVDLPTGHHSISLFRASVLIDTHTLC